MTIENDADQLSGRADDNPDGDKIVMPVDQYHQDRYPHYTHQLADEEVETSSRALIRFVPLAYGLLLGGLVNDMLLGFVGGVALSMAFDLFMGSNSMIRSLARSAFPYLCPALAVAARGLAGAIRKTGSTALSNLREMRCEAARF